MGKASLWRWQADGKSGALFKTEEEARRDAVRCATYEMRCRRSANGQSPDRGTEHILPEQADALWPSVARLGYAIVPGTLPPRTPD